MAKIHTRLKRKYGLSTHGRHYTFFHPPIKKESRPKTFSTQEGAKAWAEKKGLKPAQYMLKNVKRNKRYEVVMQDGKNQDSSGDESN